MAGTPFRDGPTYVAAAAADLYTPASGVHALVRHIRLANKDSSLRTVTLYLGATGGSAGGTEIVPGTGIAANDVLDAYFPGGLMVRGATDYISGVAGTVSTITATIMGELYVSAISAS